MLDFVVAIPARYASTRLPGKPLRLIRAEPMIAHVVRRAMESGAREVVVATDDVRVAEAVAGFDVVVCMTRADHASGTDRLAECAAQLGWTDEQIVVNLQGDEPFAPAEGIRHVAAVLAGSIAPMATLAAQETSADAFLDPNTVKVVVDRNNMAMYFSRAPIPWHRERLQRDRLSPLSPAWLRHIGIYAYRAGFLGEFAGLDHSPLEAIEFLEQLRVLEAGFDIAVGVSNADFPPGVDTEQDLLSAQGRGVA